MPCPLASKLAGELAPRAQSNTEATTKEPAVPADKLHITLAGREHVVEAGTTAGDVLASLANIGAAGGADGGREGGAGGHGSAGQPEAPVAARVNGTPRDLAWQLLDGDDIEGIDVGSPDGLAILRHSTAHVLAQAVQQLRSEERRVGKECRSRWSPY